MANTEQYHTVCESKVNEDFTKAYNVYVTWHAGQKFPDEAPAKQIEKEKLQHLLKEMAHRLNYRKFMESVTDPFVITEESDNFGRSYRIESASKVDISDPDPVVDLRFIFERYNTNAVVKIHLKPKKAPDEFQDALIDDMESFWIATKPRHVVGQIQEAMLFSLEHDCETEIVWEIEEV